ncbi:MAG: hypothetical protein ED559_04570 [Phycisphaera sp.]|nr:MAG: hypothetical protein ED559_04570 [Phycisphaera sp.]
MLVAIAILSTVQPQPVEPASDPAPILAQLCESNESGVSADLVRIATPNTNAEPSVITMTFRRSAGAEGTLTRVELPEVTFFHDGAFLRAERTGEGNHAVVYETAAPPNFAEAISHIAPVWPMPRLWTLDEFGSAKDPALGTIAFSHAILDGSMATLIGEIPAGEVTVLIDTETDSVLSLEAQVRDGSILCTYTPIETGEPDAWRIEPDGRWVVRRLAQLSLAGPPIETGVTLPDLGLITPDYSGISLSEIQSLDQIRRSGPWVVLLMLKADSTPDVYDLSGEVARGVWSRAANEIAALGADDVSRYWLGHRSLIVAVTTDLDILPDRVKQIAAIAPPGIPTLISTEPELTLDRLDRELPLTAILVDPERTVGAVVPIENAETGISAILDAMRSYTRPSAEPEAPVLSSE